MATNSVAERLVMANSSGVNHPDVSGQVVTSACDSGGKSSEGTSHSFGIDAKSAARFLAPISSHVSPSAGLEVPDVVVMVGKAVDAWLLSWLIVIVQKL